MSNQLPTDYRGLDLHAIADSIDRIFQFTSSWEAHTGPGVGSWEHDGRIVVDLESCDRLGDVVDAGPATIGHVFRYVLAHLKAHHYQELRPVYSKPYNEDIRPYEIDA